LPHLAAQPPHEVHSVSRKGDKAGTPAVGVPGVPAVLVVPDMA